MLSTPRVITRTYTHTGGRMKVSFQMSHAQTPSEAIHIVRAARLQRVRANGKLRDQNLRRMVERWAAREYPRQAKFAAEIVFRFTDL